MVNEGNQRDPKQSRILGEQFLSNRCFYSGGIVRQPRAEFRQVSLSGTGGSNPPRSANES
jgi:hypothetical protein